MKLTAKGYKTNLFSESLCVAIRKRLGLTEKELPNKVIRNTIKFINTEIGNFILDNPEGIQLLIGNQPNGVLAVSKHMPKEMRTNKFSKLEEIEELNIPDYYKKIILKRYDTATKRRIAYNSLKEEERQYNYNPHSFFFCYRIMWFNKRNCKIKKTMSYRFEPVTNLRKALEDKIRKGFDYDELNFHNFYGKKLKAV